MNWKTALKRGRELVLATSSKNGQPRAIIVISLGFYTTKLLIGACVMKKTFENLKENNRISIFVKDNKKYYRIDGITKIYYSGVYLNAAIKKSNPPLPYAAITVDIKEVFDLNKLKKVF